MAPPPLKKFSAPSFKKTRKNKRGAVLYFTHLRGAVPPAWLPGPGGGENITMLSGGALFGNRCACRAAAARFALCLWRTNSMHRAPLYAVPCALLRHVLRYGFWHTNSMHCAPLVDMPLRAVYCGAVPCALLWHVLRYGFWHTNSMHCAPLVDMPIARCVPQPCPVYELWLCPACCSMYALVRMLFIYRVRVVPVRCAYTVVCNAYTSVLAMV